MEQRRRRKEEANARLEAKVSDMRRRALEADANKRWWAEMRERVLSPTGAAIFLGAAASVLAVYYAKASF